MRFYAPDCIPRDLLEEDLNDIFDEATRPLRSLLGDSTLDDAIRMLRRFSLIDTGSDFISVHRLVQMAVREKMPPSARAEFVEHAVSRLRGRCPQNLGEKKALEEFEKVLSHAIEIIQYSLEYNINLLFLLHCSFALDTFFCS